MTTDPARLSSEARVATTRPGRYLAQLCKHFQHKLPVTFTDDRGHIAFPAGSCDLAAEPAAGVLVMRVAAGDGAALAKLEDVVARHLVRFAFREPPEIHWTRTA